jgi:putative ABC transport system permease protein
MKRPALFAAAVFTLALGIGANTALVSVVHAVLLRQLPFAHAVRTVWISPVRPGRNDAPFSLPDLLDDRNHPDALDSTSRVGSWNGNLTGPGTRNGMRVCSPARRAKRFDPLAILQTD